MYDNVNIPPEQPVGPELVSQHTQSLRRIERQDTTKTIVRHACDRKDRRQNYKVCLKIFLKLQSKRDQSQSFGTSRGMNEKSDALQKSFHGKDRQSERPAKGGLKQLSHPNIWPQALIGYQSPPNRPSQATHSPADHARIEKIFAH